jgi:hypothetical protein
MNNVKRITLAAASLLITGGAMAAASTVPARAQAQPTASVAATHKHCSGDVCAQVTSLSGNSMSVRTWAPTREFIGHFELITPHGVHRNSPGGAWHVGGRGWTFRNVNVESGTYTAKAWEHLGGSHYVLLGSVTFSAP